MQGSKVRIVTLDLLRFFAAISVVLYHYTARPSSNSFEDIAVVTQFGYLGVPLFFIISGYVISLSAHSRTAIEFAISRFVRLYPAYWAGIAVTLACVWLWGDYDYSLSQILTNLTMLNDYLGQENIDGVYWTLQAELKFYACVFLLVALGLFDKFKIWLPIWLVISATFLLFKQPFFMGWFISPSYSPFFIAGVCFYLIHKKGPDLFNLAILAGSLVLSCIRAYDQAGGFTLSQEAYVGWIAMVSVIVFYAFFYLLATDKLNLKSQPIFIKLGALTYPLYLVHNVAGKTLIDSYKDSIPEWIMVIITILLMLIVSYLIHIVIEQRIATPLKKLLFSVSHRLPLIGQKAKI